MIRATWRRCSFEDQRRRRTGRHLLDQRLRDRGDLGVGGADIDVGLEEYLTMQAIIGIATMCSMS